MQLSRGEGGVRQPVGRERERLALREMLDTTRSGYRAALVVRGPIGVGKSWLLAYLEDSASDFAVTRASGAESEKELPYAGLQLVCAPMLGRVGQLPAPQRDALRVALGLASGKTPDRFLVGLAVLNLMAAASDVRPLLCVVDDAQWLDRATVETLAFVARRLQAEPVALVFAVREPTNQPDLDGLPALEVGGLNDKDAHALLATALPGRIDQRVKDRIVAESRGIPLALLELPRGLNQVELAGGYRTPAHDPLVGRIERSYRRRLGHLPADTRLLLLLAAAEPIGQVPLLWRAAARLGVSAEAATPAIADGLVEVDARVRFAHPLLRSVIYREANPAERRRVHQVLAEETATEADPDRRAWHRAQAAIAPDEDVAAELESSAGRAQARGGLAAAAAFLESASALTPDPVRRARRGLAAARIKNLAGASEEALNLLSAAEISLLSPLDQARADLLRGQIAFASSRARDAPPLLLKAARNLEPLDSSLAGKTYLETLSATFFAVGLGAEGVQREVATAARNAVRTTDQPPAVRLLLGGLATRLIDGYAAAAPILKQALHAYRGIKPDIEEDLRWAYLASWVAIDLWDDESWYELAERQLTFVRESGAISMLPITLGLRIYLHVMSGELAEGEFLIAEAETAIEAMRSQFIPYPECHYAALQGRYAYARPLIDKAVAQERSRGEGFGVAAVALASAVLSNGNGRFEEALEAALLAGSHPANLGATNWSLPEVIEAGTRGPSRSAAVEAMRLLTDSAQSSATDWALGVEARCRALLSSGAEAETLFREAIDRLGRTRMKVDHTRAHLLYGEWLRRADRRREAREQLQIAHDVFTAMKVEGFAQRAARELEAADGVARPVTISPIDNLTPQELQIATLARDGFTNPQIGTRLFISPRTVEWHMSRILAKLGVTTRRALRNAIPGTSGSFSL
uniref:helix-turn-helix transcriptional regulator n=1 Tax=Paractinoplanes polyasparticus TaxID=2856853 RepID=UPI001C84D454|nr:LuxR family transcriptional regulator [Actinoplanes polyasparticus]